MKKIRKANKFIFLGVSVLTLGLLVTGTKVLKNYDAVIAGFLNTESAAANNEMDSGSSGVIEKSNGAKLCTELLEEGTVLLKNGNVKGGTKKSLPLDSRKRKVNIFGYGATDEGWLQFAVGSGGTPPQAKKSVNLLKAFDNSNYSYNKNIIDAYKSLNWKARLEGKSSDTKKAYVYYQYEASRNWYESNGVLEQAKSYSDTAIYVISRVSGENTRTDSVSKESVPAEQTLYTDGATTGVRKTNRTYLQTTEVEEGVIDMLHENFKNVILVINSTNAMFLDTADDRIQSILYVGTTGECCATAIPEILWGEVNPSGHLSDTFPLVPKADPAFANRNDYTTPVFQESIYFGYKWYETADTMGFWESDFSKTKLNISKYEEAVYRPFGYGESYTNFNWEFEEAAYVKKDSEGKEISKTPISSGSTINNNDEITVKVKVTNKGEVEGKDVVQLYYTAPYTQGKIEKASTNLLDFDKTISLKPGESQTLSLSFTPYDMASFDTYDANANSFSGYELDGGNYVLQLKSDAHNVKENTTDFILKVAPNGLKFEKDPVTGTTVIPQFSGSTAYKNCSIDGNGFIGSSGAGQKYLSRSNFEGTFALYGKKSCRQSGRCYCYRDPR